MMNMLTTLTHEQLEAFEMGRIRLDRTEISYYRVDAVYNYGYERIRFTFRPSMEKDIIQLQTVGRNDDCLHVFLQFYEHVYHWFENESPQRLRYVTGEKEFVVVSSFKGNATRFLESKSESFQQEFRSKAVHFLRELSDRSFEKEAADWVQREPDVETFFNGLTDPTFVIVGETHDYLIDWLEEEGLGVRQEPDYLMLHYGKLTNLTHESGVIQYLKYEKWVDFLREHGFVLRHGKDVNQRIRQWKEKKR